MVRGAKYRIIGAFTKRHPPQERSHKSDDGNTCNMATTTTNNETTYTKWETNKYHYAVSD